MDVTSGSVACRFFFAFVLSLPYASLAIGAYRLSESVAPPLFIAAPRNAFDIEEHHCSCDSRLWQSDVVINNAAPSTIYRLAARDY